MTTKLTLPAKVKFNSRTSIGRYVEIKTDLGFLGYLCFVTNFKFIYLFFIFIIFLFSFFIFFLLERHFITEAVQRTNSGKKCLSK